MMHFKPCPLSCLLCIVKFTSGRLLANASGIGARETNCKGGEGQTKERHTINEKTGPTS